MTSDNRFSDASTYHPPGAYDPFAPRRSSRLGLWILLGGGLLLGLACCGGVGAVLMFGVNVMTTEIRDQVRDNPKLREQVGEITHFDIDWFGSMAEEGDDTFRYKVRGTKAAGELTVTHHTDDAGDEVIDEAWLRLPDGAKVKIVPLDSR
jgi:hypothetical protein